jgi:hypothetical protein
LIEVEYSSNNSDGNWWLEKKDWLALEKAGWWIEWGGLDFCNDSFSLKPPRGLPTEPCELGKGPDGQDGWNYCKGHRRFESANDMTKDDLELGAYASVAKKSFATVADAIREFEAVTGQDASDEGCNCCGAPHSFSWNDGHASGDDVAAIVTGQPPISYREALALLAKR